MISWPFLLKCDCLFLPIYLRGEHDAAYDEEVVGEGFAGDGFAEAVVAGGEVEQADMGIDGSGVVGGYGAQDGGETEVLGEGYLLPVAVSLSRAVRPQRA